jgi:hypothetical protein
LSPQDKLSKAGKLAHAAGHACERYRSHAGSGLQVIDHLLRDCTHAVDAQPTLLAAAALAAHMHRQQLASHLLNTLSE